MKKFPKPMSGFSFIEILMFLSIVGAIVAFGMYSYGIIGSGGKAEEVLEKIQGINSAIASMQSTGNVSLNSMTTESITSMLPADGLTTPWGGKIVLAGTSSDSYTINIPMMPAAICPKIMQKLSTNTRYDLSSTRCPDDKEATVSFTYTYHTSQQEE